MFSQRTHWKLTPNRYTAALEGIRTAGRAFIDLTVSNPTQCGFHYDSEKILAAIKEKRAKQLARIPAQVLDRGADIR